MKLSIITATYNHRDYIQRLYRSLCLHSADLAWEWLIGDSGGDDTASFVDSLNDPRLRHFRVTRTSYSEINNELAGLVRAEALVFLNNDTHVLEGWWQQPLALIELPDVAIAGSTLYNEDGSIQSAGMGVASKPPYSFNFLKLPRSSGTPDVFLVPAVSGACLFCRAVVFKALGGFDPSYHGGYYEDTDLCLRAYASGRAVVVSGESHIVHTSRGSLDVSREFWHRIPDNQNEFGRRWTVVLCRLENLGPLPFRSRGSDVAVCLNPWLSTLGGGEREFTWAVELLSRCCTHVTVCGDGDKETIQRELADKFGNIFPSAVSVKAGVCINDADTIVWDQTYYDVTTNYSNATRTHLKRIMFGPTSVRLARGPHYMFNSQYTKSSLRATPNASIVYPPVDQTGILLKEEARSKTKNKVIVNVGRFSGRQRYLNWKNQDALVRFFHRWQHYGEFQLVLIGNVNDEAYYRKCTSLAATGRAAANILFRPGISLSELHSWLHDSMFFVSFAGYQGVTAAQAEHFGMALVEAMAAGCVCLAYAAGGHTEIIENQVDGFLWKTEGELARLLTDLTDREDVRETVTQKARQKARQFSPMFAELQVRRILHQLHSDGDPTR